MHWRRNQKENQKLFWTEWKRQHMENCGMELKQCLETHSANCWAEKTGLGFLPKRLENLSRDKTQSKQKEPNSKGHVRNQRARKQQNRTRSDRGNQEIRSWLFEINHIDKSLTHGSGGKKREKRQIINIRTERGNISNPYIKRIMPILLTP